MGIEEPLSLPGEIEIEYESEGGTKGDRDKEDKEERGRLREFPGRGERKRGWGRIIRHEGKKRVQLRGWPGGLNKFI